MSDDDFAELEESPDITMTYPGPEDRYAGIRFLWLKVIQRAVYDWVTYRESNKLHQKKIAESAYTWLFNRSELFNSFENVCVYLDINPGTVRERASLMTKEDVTKIEFLERTSSNIELAMFLEPLDKEQRRFPAPRNEVVQELQGEF